MQLETCLAETETTLLKKAAEYRFGLNQHRAGVKLLAYELLCLRPDAFPSIAENPSMLMEFLELHDQSKYLPKYFWEMVRFYGVAIRNLPSFYRQNALQIIHEMNVVDEENARMFFVSHGLIDEEGELNALAKELLRIERIADVVERGSSRLAKKEFGRTLIKGSQFLSDAGDVELALCVEASCVFAQA